MQQGPISYQQNETLILENILLDDILELLCLKLDLHEIATFQRVCKLLYIKLLAIGYKTILTRLNTITNSNLISPIDKPKNYYWQKAKKELRNLKILQANQLHSLKFKNPNLNPSFFGKLEFSTISDCEQNKIKLSRINNAIFFFNFFYPKNQLELPNKGLNKWPDNPQQIDDALKALKFNTASLPFNIMTVWQNITIININNNFLVNLPHSFIFPNLLTLNLDNNQLSQLPRRFTQMTSLTSLSLYGNKFKSLPHEFKLLTNLIDLALGNNDFLEVPDCIEFIKLRSLNLSNMQLSKLPKWLDKLTHLNQLYLHNNYLTDLPLALSTLVNLNQITLSRNKLTSLPKCLQYYIDLEKLSLNHNQLKALPIEFTRLTNLYCLSLNNNIFSDFPNQINSLINLRELNLNNNCITELPLGINLRPLNRTSFLLDNNFLETIPDGLFNQFGLAWSLATLKSQFPKKSIKAYSQAFKKYLDNKRFNNDLSNILVDNLAPHFHPHQSLFFSTWQEGLSKAKSSSKLHYLNSKSKCCIM